MYENIKNFNKNRRKNSGKLWKWKIMTCFNIICHKKSKKYQKKQKKKFCHRWDSNRGQLRFWKVNILVHSTTLTHTKKWHFWHFLRWFQQRKWPFVLIFSPALARHTTHILSQKPHQKSLTLRRRCGDRQTDRQTDGQTDGQSADNSVLFPRGKCAKKNVWMWNEIWTLVQ